MTFPNLIRSFFMHQQDLTYSDGIMFKGISMIVPNSACEDMKHLLLAGHFGIVKPK